MKFNELIEEIKEIRLSERILYQKITDLFEVTSSDYDKSSKEAESFLKIVQNKLHFAITGYTAAELIYKRVSANKDNLGLTSWKNSPNGKIYRYDIGVAKNYLNKNELNKLKDLTNLFLDIAEMEAKEQKVMKMSDWIAITDDLLKFRRKNLLNDSGIISHKKALDKANEEYEKYRIKQDETYVSSMDELYIKYLNDKEAS